MDTTRLWCLGVFVNAHDREVVFLFMVFIRVSSIPDQLLQVHADGADEAFIWKAGVDRALFARDIKFDPYVGSHRVDIFQDLVELSALEANTHGATESVV